VSSGQNDYPQPYKREVREFLEICLSSRAAIRSHAPRTHCPSYVDTRSDFRADSRTNWSLQARHLIVEWCDPHFAGFSDAGG
jgi:hypothetical protein